MTNQYIDSGPLNARAQIYRFSTAKQDWLSWVFDQLDLPYESRILEIGCGTGVLWTANIQQIPNTWKMTLTDLSPGMLEEARSRLADAGGMFEFSLADAESLPFPEESFDAVIANHMLYHVPDLGKALSEIHRVLRHGGKLYASTNGKNHMRELHDLVFDITPSIGRHREAEHFDLENGSEQLGRYFSHIEIRRHEGDLKVTDAQAVVDYAMSLDDAKDILTEDALVRLESTVREEIHRRGSMRITRDAGLFVVTKGSIHTER